MLSSRAARLVLASASPRRAELLGRMGLPFDVVVTDVEESVLPGEPPESYVERLALDKAHAGFRPGSVTIGSDTTVVVEGEILGKPADREQGLRMLEKLAGRTHFVHTGVAVFDGVRANSTVVTSRVLFGELTAQEIAAYWATGEGTDKAGAYGIQGIGGILVKKIEGSYSGVMGLPVFETEALLKSVGVDTWQLRKQWVENHG